MKGRRSCRGLKGLVWLIGVFAFIPAVMCDDMSLTRRLLQQEEEKVNESKSCPADYNMVKVVGPGCGCNPVPALGQGLCPAGYVCAEPWTVRLMEASKEGTSTDNLKKESRDEFPEFKCHPCGYGQLCGQGSTIPALSSYNIQA